MRIAHIITRLILGGAQENTVLCCRDLLQQFGDEVLLVTGPARGPEGSLIEQARQDGIPLHLIDALRRPIHPWRDVESYRQIRKALEAFQPDVVHTHSAKGGMLGRFAARSLRVPAIVHTVHGAPFHAYQSRAAFLFFRACERLAARRCDRLVSVADAMTDLMVDAGVAPRDKFRTIYSGMEVEPFLDAHTHRERVRAELGYEPQHIVVGKIARLFHLKGHADVIASAREVIAWNRDVRFLFVGDGTLRADVQRKIADLGLQEYFRFTGLVAPERVAPLIGAMDLLVHTSLREGLARTLPQALIAQRPVISYDIDGAREVVLDGVTGRLVAPGDVQELAEAIKSLAADPAQRTRMGQEGRRRFCDRFRHQVMTEALRALYGEILGAK